VRYHCLYQSPIGLLHLVSDGSALIGLTFVDNQTEPSIVEERGAGPFPQAVEQGAGKRLVYRLAYNDDIVAFKMGLNGRDGLRAVRLSFALS
jgi:hypothetical protein